MWCCLAQVDLVKWTKWHTEFLFCPVRACWKQRDCESEASRMQPLYFGCFLHNGHSVKSGTQLRFDSQQSTVSPGPSEPGTEPLGWDPLAACQYSTAQHSWTASALIDSLFHCLCCLSGLSAFPSHFTYIQLPSGSRLFWFLMTCRLRKTTSSVSMVNFTSASG